MEPLLNRLNAPQKEAATTIDQNVRIIAGAGSGKTTVLMARIEYLINEIGVYPSRILAITFTNKAANEMKERLRRQVGDDAAKVRISTIHALCVRILREDIDLLGYPKNFTILDGEDQKSIIRKIFKELDIPKTELPIPTAISIISDAKRTKLPAKTFKSVYDGAYTKMPDVYAAYEKTLLEMKALDFDDLLLFTEHLLNKMEPVRTKWQNRLDYLHVDEFQDVDPVQNAILEYLSRKDAIVCVVGDPDQTIYTWRGASIDLILDFDKHFTPCKTVILNENYRSTSPILQASNAVVKNNTNRIPKDLFTKLPGDEKVVLHQTYYETDEASYVTRQIQDLHNKGMRYSDMAILYRANYCSRSFEKSLQETGIPYEVYGGVRFYDRAEIKDILSYLKLLTNPSAEDPENRSLNLAVSRVINVPKRRIGAASVEKLSRYADAQGINMLEAAAEPKTISSAAAAKIRGFYEIIEDIKKEMPGKKLSEIVGLVLDYSGYEQMLKDQKDEERLKNIESLQQDLEEAQKAQPDLKLEEYLQNISLFSERSTKEEEQNGVRLMTVHASKGTEYPAVFIVGFNEEVFPSRRAVQSSSRDAIEEERRLCYVAMTRTKERLFITWNTDVPLNGSFNREPSRFLQEIPESCIEREKRKINAYNGSSALERVQKMKSRRRHSTSFSNKKPQRTVHMHKGDIVDHSIYGEGVVLNAEAGIAAIAFDAAIGVKKIKIGHPSLTLKKGRE